MTDRVKGFVVVLENDIRIDDVETIQKAIAMIKGVADVTPDIANSDDWMARARVKSELRGKFYKFMTEELQ